SAECDAVLHPAHRCADAAFLHLPCAAVGERSQRYLGGRGGAGGTSAPEGRGSRTPPSIRRRHAASAARRDREAASGEGQSAAKAFIGARAGDRSRHGKTVLSRSATYPDPG